MQNNTEDKPSKALSRRSFLLGSAALLGGTWLAHLSRAIAQAGTAAHEVFLPLIHQNSDGSTPVPTHEQPPAHQLTGTNTQTATPTRTPSPSTTATRTPSSTVNTATATRTSTRSHTPTATQTGSPTATATGTGTPTATRTATGTATRTRTNTPTATRTRTNTPTTPSAGRPRVVHIRHASATNWAGGSSPTFFQSVNQSAVNSMVLAGLTALTGQSTWSAIWSQLFNRVRPGGYSPGQKIAIKVNFNNSSLNSNTCATHNNIIDGLPHPVIGLLAGMQAAGVRNSDIVLYDASAQVGRLLPDYFRSPISSAYPGVTYVGMNQCGVTGVTYGKDSSLTVTFPGTSIQNRLLPDLLYDATYVINMPILKTHGGNAATPVTLGFKNHMGSINFVYQSTPSNSLHEYINPAGAYYNAYASPYVPVYQHQHIGPKTVLTVGDGLFGAFGSNATAKNSWTIFGGPANSLLFGLDPVATDCVMADILRAEGGFSVNSAYDYLFCAQTAGLGVCEGTRGSPGGNPLQTPYGSGYSEIEYIRQNL
ncbi:MAG: DUF362 domain-containing protein [Chloroflexota bacterium]